MKILITTGIYPPKIGGPSQYAKNMLDLWSKMGHKVTVKTYGIENSLPTGIRHIWFFFKILPSLLASDFIFALDTYSVGFPSVFASFIFRKKIIIRTGGDFLWEGYVERTGDLVLLRDFYKTRISRFSLKEKIIFHITGWTIRNCNILVFSTNWQKDIFLGPYNLNNSKITIIENHYDKKEKNLPENVIPENKDFIASTRPLKWKNIKFLKSIFENDEIKSKGAVIVTNNLPYEEFLGKIKKSYAIILVSLGDISPHMILDAINLNKPFILTKECGILDRVKDVSLLVNPKDEDEVKEKILWLLNEENYRAQVEKIKNFSFVHTWEEIADEYMNVYNSIK